MTETEIKAAVLQHVRAAAGRKRKPIVANEFRLGTSSVRADLAILADEFIGIEIKSARDSLRRLIGQLEGYTRYFDRVILIVAEKHLSAAQGFPLGGSALWVVDDTGRVREVRKPDANRLAAASSYSDLLTQADVRRFISRLPAEVPIEEALKQALHQAFSARYAKTSDDFWKKVARRRIAPADLQILSRYAEQRTLHRDFLKERDEFWRDWANQVRTKPSLPNPPQSQRPLPDYHSTSESEDGR